jgi:ParB-like chromosome segregation protein Spo0J
LAAGRRWDGTRPSQKHRLKLALAPIEKSRRTNMEYHPLANAFPLLEGAEFDELVASIRARGQLEKIIVFEDRILDGRNRYRACLAAGVEPHSEDFEGTFEEARDLVIDANLRRRHLDASQRALIAARLATIGHGGDRRSDQRANLPDVTQAAAAERLNVASAAFAMLAR